MNGDFYSSDDSLSLSIAISPPPVDYFFFSSFRRIFFSLSLDLLLGRFSCFYVSNMKSSKPTGHENKKSKRRRTSFSEKESAKTCDICCQLLSDVTIIDGDSHVAKHDIESNEAEVLTDPSLNLCLNKTAEVEIQSDGPLHRITQVCLQLRMRTFIKFD